MPHPMSTTYSPLSSPKLDPAFPGRRRQDQFHLRRTNRSATTAAVPPMTKIICTIGPSTKDVESLSKLLNAGMNVARLNFSHGTHEYHAEVIANVREVMQKTKRLCAIMLDTKGPEIRTGKLVGGKEVELKQGQEFTLLMDEPIEGDNTKVFVQYANLGKVVKKGNIVLFDDGLISMRVKTVSQERVTCEVLNTGILGQTKGVNLPGVVVDLPAVTEKDAADLRFGVAQGVDFIAASFIRNAAGVKKIREVLGEDGANIRIISKIENQEGLDNFDDILAETDGIMIARGDLGVEIPIDQVAIAQKMMIRKCNIAGKVVVTATQMLDSMIFNPSPTRAEASDVANAVFDGTDCVMLSGETAKGAFPVEAVKVMAAICHEAEANFDYRNTFRALRRQLLDPVSISEAIASSAVKAAFDLKASMLVVLTETGETARFVAKYRSESPVLCVTATDQTARQSLCSRGLLPLLVGSMIGSDSLIARVIGVAKHLGICNVGDVVVSTGSVTEGKAGSTNILKVLTVDR